MPDRLVITTPWWPSENNPFAGSFVAAQAEAVAPFFDRVDVVHTEDWATPADGLSSRFVQKAYARLVGGPRPRRARRGRLPARARRSDCLAAADPGAAGARLRGLGAHPRVGGADGPAGPRRRRTRRARSHRHLRRLGGHRLRPRRLPGRRHRARHVPAAGAQAAGGARHVPAGARAGGLVLRGGADPEELAAQRLPGARRPGADLPERGADGADPAAAGPGDRPAPLDLPGQVRPAQAGRRAGRGVRRDRRGAG